MSAPGATEPVAGSCPRCGAPVRPDQDWCLQCGAALTTHVAGAPGWRTPLAIVGGVLAVAAVALVIAFIELSDDAEQEVARAPTPTPTATAASPTVTPSPDASPTVTPSPSPGASPTTTPDATGGVSPAPGASPSPSPGASPSPSPSPSSGGTGTIASWPAGRTAYTVILASETSRPAAEAKARRFQRAGRSIGVLDSDDFESLRGGYFVVFSGQYDDLEAARDAAETFRSDAPDAYARRIDPK